MNHIRPCQPTSYTYIYLSIYIHMYILKRKLPYTGHFTIAYGVWDSHAYTFSAHKYTTSHNNTLIQMWCVFVEWIRKKKKNNKKTIHSLEEKTATAMHMHTRSQHLYYTYQIRCIYFCSSFYGSRISFYRCITWMLCKCLINCILFI